MTDADKKVILITGGSKGLGFSYAKALARQHTVIITGRDTARLAQLEAEYPGLFHCITCDVSDRAAVSQCFADIVAMFGHIDVVINNAGVWGPVDKFADIALDDWYEAININLLGLSYCTHEALKPMRIRKRGIIINIVSNAGAYRWPYCTSYSVTKAAVIKLTENLAVEMKRENISVYAYHPGLVHSTGMVTSLISTVTDRNSARGKALQWVYDEQDAGNTVDEKQSMINIEKLCSGKYKSLSGLYLTVRDNLDLLLERKREIRDRDLFMLRVNSLEV